MLLYQTEKEQLGLISTARQILNAEYAKKCTEEYRTWTTVNQNIVNRTGEVLLRYPPFSGALSPLSFRSTIARPTEADVVNKAMEIYNSQKPSPYETSVPAVVEPTAADTATDKFSALTDDTVPAADTVPALTSEVPAAEPTAKETAGPALIDDTAKATSYTEGIIDIFKNPVELPVTLAEPEKEEPKSLTVATFSAEPAVEEPKSASIADRIFDIFKKPAEVPLPEAVAKEEPDPLLAPVVITKAEDDRTDYTIEVPATVLPEPEPEPVAPPQLTNSYASRVQDIFKDVPKPTGITGLIRRAFSKKDTTTKDTV